MKINILLYTTILSFITLFVWAGTYFWKRKCRKKKNVKTKHLTEEELLKTLGLTLLSEFVKKHGFFNLKKESTDSNIPKWILDFPKSVPPIKVIISEKILKKGMKSYSKNVSYKLLKDINIDVENDEFTQKGILMMLLDDQNNYIIRIMDNQYYLDERDRQSEAMWKNHLETGEEIKMGKIPDYFFDACPSPDYYGNY